LSPLHYLNNPLNKINTVQSPIFSYFKFSLLSVTKKAPLIFFCQFFHKVLMGNFQLYTHFLVVYTLIVHLYTNSLYPALLIFLRYFLTLNKQLLLLPNPDAERLLLPLEILKDVFVLHFQLQKNKRSNHQLLSCLSSYLKDKETLLHLFFQYHLCISSHLLKCRLSYQVNYDIQPYLKVLL